MPDASVHGVMKLRIRILVSSPPVGQTGLVQVENKFGRDKRHTCLDQCDVPIQV
jgi:hypothetical protein